MFGTMVLKEFPKKEEKEQRMRITLFINGKDKSILKKNTLEALKALRDEYCWYENITIQQKNTDEEISLDEEIKKYEK